MKWFGNRNSNTINIGNCTGNGNTIISGSNNTVSMTNGSIEIRKNGKTYRFKGNNITEKNGQWFIDGKRINLDDTDGIGNSEGPVTFEIHGDVQSISTEYGTVNVTGSVKEVKTKSGSVNCNAVSGNVSTISGDVQCGNVNGNVTTTSGDVECKDIKGDVSTVSGDVSNKRIRF